MPYHLLPGLDFHSDVHQSFIIFGFAMAQLTTYNYDVYQPRNPKASAYYKGVENHFEELESAWDDMYASRYGFWRTYVMTVIYKYLDCGDLHMGFARVRCEECGHEYLLAFSCKRRQFCPSCHQKRVIEYGEWLLTEVLKDVPHRQWVFSIPKRMVYVPVEDSADGIAKVVYTSKDGKSRKVFTALDWLARLTTHIPGRYEQTVRYYGCDIIEKILRHLDLRGIRNHDPPQKVSDYILELVCEKADPRIPVFESWY